jgi:hypothetical protein
MVRAAVLLALAAGAGDAAAGQDRRPPAPAATALPAPEGRTRAICGDTVEFQGRVFRLEGLLCPDPATAAGQRAKALMSTLLRAPFVACAVTGGTAAAAEGRCSRDGRGVVPGTDFVLAMRRSGLCE